jgi:hypothetical protein
MVPLSEMLKRVQHDGIAGMTRCGVGMTRFSGIVEMG